MKRLIKYWSPYNETKFSNCSTQYEVLPILVPDSAGPKELERLARELGLVRAKGAKAKRLESKNEWESQRAQWITHSMELRETKECSHRGEKSYHYKIGFINLNLRGLPAVEDCTGKITKKKAHEIVDSGWYHAQSTCEINKEYLIIMDSWDYYHDLNLLGYKLEQFEKALGIDDRVFDDSVSSCSECGAYNYNDDGHHYNFRMTPDGEYLGLECGCFDEYSKSNIEAWANKPETCVEPDAIEALVEDDKAEFIQRYVGGMTDSWRSHSYAGEAVSIGNPKDILEELLEKNPDGQYVFVHDESGQFQTYFSVYKLK